MTRADAPAADDEIERELDEFQERRRNALDLGDRIVVRDTPCARELGIVGMAGHVYGIAHDLTLPGRPLVGYAVVLDDEEREGRFREVAIDDVEREASAERPG